MEMGWRTFGVPGIAKAAEDVSRLQPLPHTDFFRDTLQVAAVIAKPVITDQTHPSAPFLGGVIALLVPFVVFLQFLNHP